LLFSAVISEHFSKKPHDYIYSGCKNMVSQKCTVFIGPPGMSYMWRRLVSANHDIVK